MKLSEFEEKLTTVSDGKLRRMLADCRKNGPEVAVKLILAEASRRGAVLEDEADPPLPDYLRRSPAASPGPASDFTPSFPPSLEAAPADRLSEAASAANAPAEADEAPATDDPEAPAVRGAWLAEEQDAGMPGFVKALLALFVLAGLGAGIFYLLGKSG